MTKKIALTIGDPAGIGPELILKLTRSLQLDESIELVVFGARSILEWTADRIPDLSPFEGEVVEVLEPSRLQLDFDFGSPSGVCAALQYHALVAAIEAAQAGRVEAVVTAPWTKYILPMAGLEPTGHTEVLAERCGVENPTMMLCGDQLRVGLVTTHIPLAEVPSVVTSELVGHHIATVDADLELRFGIAKPRIAVCGLNPHAGEAGVMGGEDERVIRPAIDEAAGRGILVDGPHAADALFARAVRGDRYDAIVAMYHDQGLIPLKLCHFGESANVTLGLPIIRTSVDHGTAYDIAGLGVADVGSFEYAVKLAVRMAHQSRLFHAVC